jgi:hypothetical protein
MPHMDNVGTKGVEYLVKLVIDLIMSVGLAAPWHVDEVELDSSRARVMPEANFVVSPEWVIFSGEDSHLVPCAPKSASDGLGIDF